MAAVAPVAAPDEPAVTPVAQTSSRVGGVLGEAAGGFTGGFAHGARYGWSVGRARYQSGAIGSVVSKGIEGFSEGHAQGRIARSEPKAIEGSPSGEAAPDRAESPERRPVTAGAAASGPAVGNAPSGGMTIGEAGHDSRVNRHWEAAQSAFGEPHSPESSQAAQSHTPSSPGVVPGNRAGVVARRSNAAMVTPDAIHATATNLPSNRGGVVARRSSAVVVTPDAIHATATNMPQRQPSSLAGSGQMHMIGSSKSHTPSASTDYGPAAPSGAGSWMQRKATNFPAQSGGFRDSRSGASTTYHGPTPQAGGSPLKSAGATNTRVPNMQPRLF